MTDTTIAYKVTNQDATAHIATGNFQWPKPSGKRTGKWVHCEGELVECRNGLHACESPVDILSHLNGSCDRAVWLVEAKGDRLTGAGKTAFRSMRLVKRLAFGEHVCRLFAADCADRALSPIGDAAGARSWNAVFAVRGFVRGEVSAAAWDAAWAAAWDAAWAAARYAAWDAAGAAALYAARAAARAAAGAAAWDAAGAAAGAAAWDAAGAAAARDAEREWQSRRLLQYLTHGVDAQSMECDGWVPTEGVYKP